VLFVQTSTRATRDLKLRYFSECLEALDIAEGQGWTVEIAFLVPKDSIMAAISEWAMWRERESSRGTVGKPGKKGAEHFWLAWSARQRDSFHVSLKDITRCDRNVSLVFNAARLSVLWLDHGHQVSTLALKARSFASSDLSRCA